MNKHIRVSEIMKKDNLVYVDYLLESIELILDYHREYDKLHKLIEHKAA